MLQWVLVLALNGNYELVHAYTTEAECEYAAKKVVELARVEGRHAIGGCYEHVSTTSWAK